MEESKTAVMAREKNNFRRKIWKALGVLCQSRRLNQYNFQPYTGINFWLMTWFTKLTQQIFLPYLPVTASKACDCLTLLQYLNVYYVCTVGKQYLYPIVSYSFLSFVFLSKAKLFEKGCFAFNLKRWHVVSRELKLKLLNTLQKFNKFNPDSNTIKAQNTKIIFL